MEATPKPLKTLVPEAEAKLKIPHGTSCYKNIKVKGLELDEYDRTLQAQFPDDPEARFTYMLKQTRVYCPYWSATDYGTAKCSYLGIEGAGINAGDWGKSSEAFWVRRSNS